MFLGFVEFGMLEFGGGGDLELFDETRSEQEKREQTNQLARFLLVFPVQGRSGFNAVRELRTALIEKRKRLLLL